MRRFRTRMTHDNRHFGIGHEVHVDGWGDGPFFTVRGFDGDNVLLSTRYSRQIKHRVDFRRAYFTRASTVGFTKKINGIAKEVAAT